MTGFFFLGSLGSTRRETPDGAHVAVAAAVEGSPPLALLPLLLLLQPPPLSSSFPGLSHPSLLSLTHCAETWNASKWTSAAFAAAAAEASSSPPSSAAGAQETTAVTAAGPTSSWIELICLSSRSETIKSRGFLDWARIQPTLRRL